MLRTVTLLLILAAPAAAQPVELGLVDWLRDFDEAAARARASGKPIMVLFDEVPG